MSCESFYRKIPSNILVKKIYSIVEFNFFLSLSLENLLSPKLCVQTKRSPFVSRCLMDISDSVQEGYSFIPMMRTVKDTVVLSRVNYMSLAQLQERVNVFWNSCLNLQSESWLKARRNLVT